jgi:hypothetical protein
MLTLFLLIGTAFIVSANHYRQTQKTLARLTETSNSTIDQDDLLNEVISQIVRDTHNQNSSLRFHSLLRDMYGNDGMFTVAANATWAYDPNSTGPSDPNPTDSQFMQIQLPTTAGTVLNHFGLDVTAALSPVDHVYNGLVLTFLDGPARNQSTRIVGYLSRRQTFRFVTPRLADGTTLTDPSLLNGSRIAVNGRPFNGTGVGYNPFAPASAARLTTTENHFGTPLNMALTPNSAFQGMLLNTEDFDDQQVADLRATIFDNYYFSNNQMFALGIDDLTDTAQNREAIRLKNLIGTAGLGGSDESYDAVDFQNYMLSLVPPNPGENALPGDQALIDRGPDNTLGTFDDSQVVIPSLHRPALINYWRQQILDAGGELEDDPKLLRRVVLRPNWLDHPSFTGSNPTYANLASSADPNLERLLQMIYGAWDVDNDNDGIRDSIWVDFGAPVMENSDGRLVKPLAALLVVDMDGRLNLNAHGSEEHLKWDLTGVTTTPEDDLPTPLTLAGGLMSDRVARGHGYGPAEISLAPLMPLDTTGTLSVVQQRRKWFRRFIGGVQRGDRIVPNADSNTVAQSPTPTPRLDFLRSRTGKLGNDTGARIVPGQLGVDLAAQLKMQGVPLRASAGSDPANTFVRGGYATPPDFKGRYALGLNALGQPVYEAIPDAYSNSDNLLVKSLKSLLADTPYETNLSLGASRGESTDSDDGPYTIVGNGGDV